MGDTTALSAWITKMLIFYSVCIHTYVHNHLKIYVYMYIHMIATTNYVRTYTTFPPSIKKDALPLWCQEHHVRVMV